MSNKLTWQHPTLNSELNALGQEVGLPLDNWQGCKAPSKISMSGQYCSLVPFSVEEHSDALFDAFATDTDARNWTYLPYGPFANKEDFAKWCSTTCTSADTEFYTVIDKSNNRITGMASYLRIQAEIGSIEVGHIHFSPLMQGTRLATESMYLMMKRIFDDLGYRRYEWKCNALNMPSCKAAQRFGFQFEGIFRQAAIAKERNRDTAWFSIIDSEWPAIKAGYMTWLDESNFDSDGRQVRGLQECMGS